MRIAVIGATGLLGRALFPRLLAKDYQILAISPHPEKAHALYGSSIQAAYGDLLAANLESHFTQLLQGYEAVLNLATSLPKAEDLNQAGAFDKNNQIRKEGTPRLLEAIRAAGVETYIQQSITMAYPDSGDDWIFEDAPIQSPALAAMENAITTISPNELAWTILRGAIFVGKETYQEETIRALKAHEPLMACEGQAYQSYVHVDDMAEAVFLALEKKPAGKIFNICAEAMREGEYLRQLAKSIGVEKIMPKESPCPASQRCSNQAAKEILGWETRQSLFPVGSIFIENKA